jgi:hypothetical protein
MIDFEVVEISKHVVSYTDGYWEWFERTGRPYKITGKYLFFSSDRDLLKKIAIDEIENNGFHVAKINMTGKKIGEEYVLCLYFKDDSRKNEIAEKYKNMKGIKYRYWKSDIDTLSGKYSEEFLKKLKPKERKMFTKPKM